VWDHTLETYVVVFEAQGRGLKTQSPASAVDISRLVALETQSVLLVKLSLDLLGGYIS
jgi:hypothetical protein